MSPSQPEEGHDAAVSGDGRPPQTEGGLTPTPSLTAAVDEGEGGAAVRGNGEEDEAAAASDGEKSGMMVKNRKKNKKKKHPGGHFERVLPQAMFKKLYQELMEFKLKQSLLNGAAPAGGGEMEEEEAAAAVNPASVASSGWGPLPKTEFVAGLLDLCRKGKEKLVRPRFIFHLRLCASLYFSSPPLFILYGCTPPPINGYFRPYI